MGDKYKPSRNVLLNSFKNFIWQILFKYGSNWERKPLKRARQPSHWPTLMKKGAPEWREAAIFAALPPPLVPYGVALGFEY